MKRALFAAVVLLVPTVVVLAQLDDPKPTTVTAGTLPVTRVVLFTSGVAYFERAGDVDGDVRVDLLFPVNDVNDLLKSMVLQDLGGGKVRAVGYDSQDPLERSLKSYAVNLSNNPSFSQVLGQVRGEKVEVLMQNTTAPILGTVMGVEKKTALAEKGAAVEVELLNLWCADGLRGVKLADVQRVRFLNPKLEDEVRRALDLLATGHDTQKKAVGLLFTGTGKRGVRVGYVVESPVWKTSYRLVLSPDGKSLLQGWALVENTTEEDWKDVDMRLVSGRPFSFRMDLYRPLYVQRPLVELETVSNVRPPVHEPDFGRDKDKAPSKDMAKDGFGYKDKKGGPPGEPKSPPRPEPLDPSVGVDARAYGDKVGDYFQYKIDSPVSMARQKSAMLPILNERVETKRVAVYNPGTHPRHPMLAMRLKNSTKLHLMQGPITVFAGDSYAGDARILDVQPGEERLVSYGIDQGVEVAVRDGEATSRVAKMTLFKGVMTTTFLQREHKVYEVKNRFDEARTVLVEHPYRPQFQLAAPAKPAERTATLYRFEVAAAAGKAEKLEVVEERQVAQTVSLTNADDERIAFVLNGNDAGAALKAALRQAVERKGKVSTARVALATLERDLRDLTEDQARIRANMERVPKDSDAYRRYLKKFDEQEPQFETLQKDIKKQRAEVDRLHQELDDFLAKLSAE